MSDEKATKPAISRRVLSGIGLSAWVFGGFFLAQVVLVALLYALQDMGVSFAGVDDAVLNSVVAALVYLLTLAIVIGLPIKLKKAKVSLQDIGLARSMNWQDLLLAPAGFIAYGVISATLISTVMELVPSFNSEQAQDVGFQGITQQYEYILAFVTLVVIAPVAEEILMRGYLYGKLRKIMPTFGAMLLTAAVFAALHMQWNVAVDVFALSLVMTSLREISGSIWAGILLHMIKNGLAFYILFINPSFLHIMGG